MNIFKEAIMTCKRILEYEAMMATPEFKTYDAEHKAYKEAEKALEATPEWKDYDKADKATLKAWRALKATPAYKEYWGIE
jgi:hypothetical protein